PSLGCVANMVTRGVSRRAGPYGAAFRPDSPTSACKLARAPFAGRASAEGREHVRRDVGFAAGEEVIGAPHDLRLNATARCRLGLRDPGDRAVRVPVTDDDPDGNGD